MRLQNYLIEVDQSDLNTLKKYVDKIWKRVNVDIQFTQHFLDQANDRRNNPEIDLTELKRLFNVLYKQHAREITKLPKNERPNGTQAVVKDLVTKVNLPFVFEWNPEKNLFNFVTKTVQRKGNFMTKNRVFELKPGYLP